MVKRRGELDEGGVLDGEVGVGEEDVDGFIWGGVEDEEGEAEEGWEGVACYTDLLDDSFFLKLAKFSKGIEDLLIAFPMDRAFLTFCESVCGLLLLVCERDEVVARRAWYNLIRDELDVMQVHCVEVRGV